MSWRPKVFMAFFQIQGCLLKFFLYLMPGAAHNWGEHGPGGDSLPDAWGGPQLRGTRPWGRRLQRSQPCTFRNHCPLRELLRHRHTSWLFNLSAKNKGAFVICTTQGACWDKERLERSTTTLLCCRHTSWLFSLFVNNKGVFKFLQEMV